MQEIGADIVNEFLKLVRDRVNTEGEKKYKKALFLSAYFYSVFESTGHEGVKRWTRGVDLRDVEDVYFPMCLQQRNHWVLVHLSLTLAANNVQTEAVFTLYDSLHMRSFLSDEWPKLQLLFKGWLLAEWNKFHATSTGMALLGYPLFRVASNAELPNQGSTLDCALYTVRTIEALATGTPIDFRPANMKYLRLLMVKEVATQQLHRKVTGESGRNLVD